MKNAERSKKNIRETLFDAMNAFELGIFPLAEEGSPTTVTVTPKPVIRLVLALASPEAGVAFRKEPAEPAIRMRPPLSISGLRDCLDPRLGRSVKTWPLINISRTARFGLTMDSN